MRERFLDCVWCTEMHNNKIYDAGAAALGKALLENDSLEFLSLSSNGVGDEGRRSEARTMHVHMHV